MSILSTRKKIDQNSCQLVPDDFEGCGELYPALIFGDGNCLPRCGSLLAYGSESNFSEIRQRIVFELVINEKLYLEHVNNKIFSMFSDHYHGQKLTPNGIQSIFRSEVLEICKNGTFMGVWQLAALANVLKRPIRSVYPLYGGKTVRNDLHRMFYPFQNKIAPSEGVTPAHIMWTNVAGAKITEKNWMPNHFVVLLKIHSLAEIVNWPWFFFYKPTGDGLWIEGETKYTLISNDVLQVLQPPSIEVKGHCLY